MAAIQADRTARTKGHGQDSLAQSLALTGVPGGAAKVPCKLLRKKNLLREAASVLKTCSPRPAQGPLLGERGWRVGGGNALASDRFLLCKPQAMSSSFHKGSWRLIWVTHICKPHLED